MPFFQLGLKNFRNPNTISNYNRKTFEDGSKTGNDLFRPDFDFFYQNFQPHAGFEYFPIPAGIDFTMINCIFCTDNDGTGVVNKSRTAYVEPMEKN